jgi:DNA relaxase NicK
MERNMFGYDRVHSILGTGFIMWNKARLDMGLHISLPSKALNVFSQFSGSETAIYELLIEARGEVDVRFTRVDVAFDTSKVTMQQVKQSIEGGELITRSREVLLQQSLRGGSGMTIYIGSGASDRRVRIYDKAAERGVGGVWTRIETQYRKKYADQVVDKILLSDVSLEMLAMTSFDFREVGNTRTNNRERSSWWAAILEEFETVVFSIKSAISTLAEKALWLEAAIAPTLAAVYLKFGPEWFERFMNAGVERISPVMQALIYQT